MSEEKRCGSCSAPVIWAVTQGHSRMPVDPEPREDGNVRLVYPAPGEHFSYADRGEEDMPLAIYDRKDGQRALDDDGVRFVSHFATCPDAKKWRRS